MNTFISQKTDREVKHSINVKRAKKEAHQLQNIRGTECGCNGTSFEHHSAIIVSTLPCWKFLDVVDTAPCRQMAMAIIACILSLFYSVIPTEEIVVREYEIGGLRHLSF